MYHQQFKPPPEGSHTGLNKVETIETVKDPSNDMEQIQHRITSFEDHWHKIKEFYESYSAIVNVNVDNSDENKISNDIQDQIELFIKNREKKRLDEIEAKRRLDALIKQKKEEEEQAKINKKKAEEAAVAAAAAAAEAQKVCLAFNQI